MAQQYSYNSYPADYYEQNAQYYQNQANYDVDQTADQMEKEIREKKIQLQSYYSEIAQNDPFAPQGSDDYYVQQAKYEDEEKKRNGGSSGNNPRYNQKSIQKEKMQQQMDNIKESQMTEHQKYNKLVENVLTSKDYEQEMKIKEIEQKVLQELPQCKIHPTNIFQNKNCRSCKKIREDYEQRKNQKLEQLLSENKADNIAIQAQQLSVHQLIQQNGPFPINCDYKNGNLPDMLRNNILSCQYFKDLYALKSFQEVIEEIKTNVTYTDAWVIGANSIPSSLFCCLYKLMLMRLNEKQVGNLIKYKHSQYVRACGALYIRFLSPHDQLWDRLSPYMLDEQEFCYSIDKSKINFGEYVEKLLEIQKKLLSIPEKRKRKLDNISQSAQFHKGSIIFAFSKRDQQWHRAKITGIHYLSSLPIIKVENYGIDEEFFQENEEFDNEYDEDDEDVRIIRKLQVNFIEGPFTKDEEAQEFLGLEDVLLINKKDEQQKHRKRSNSNDSWDEPDQQEEVRGSNQQRKRSRSRDREFKIPRERDNQDDRLLQEVIQKERDQAAASKKEDYAKRPASYKSALSLALPVGTTRKKDNPRNGSPERQHIHVQNPAVYIDQSKGDENKQVNKEELLEKMNKLKEKYGDGSAMMNLTHVFDCFEYFIKIYKNRTTLNEEEFDDVFSPLLNDTQAYFIKLQVRREFDRKIRGIYLAFDQDDNGSIDRKELLNFLYNGIFGLCKLLSIPIPRRDDVQQFAYVIFKQIDLNKNEKQNTFARNDIMIIYSIEYVEFATWIKESDDIQDFLLKYTGQQTFERARKRYRNLLADYKQSFDRIAIDFMGEKSHIVERLFMILDYENKGAVSEFEFYTVMKPWASFSATDINNDNELDSMELKTLIWLIDEEEPLESRVQRDLKLMDRDGSGTIDRLEWIQFLASPDPTTGIEIFDFSLKKAFDTHDHDKSGSIDQQELCDLLMENFEDLIKGKSDENRLIIQKLIQSLARELMTALDTRKEGSLDWSQFKNYGVVAREKEEKIKDFIRKHT
ncbi:UNKNOWN [Stylonychia lemnae]|uniref:EF-hand domain-containing protein n=1 Tax=Stylonychia lemnae TaxID=5949 RepID=A0A078A0F3_STYLE|nr:UNKNOWN [Stylonychia lemnae]|eukprot:CDW74928.1 UNKNOWN [Stylonychia lemnae]